MIDNLDTDGFRKLLLRDYPGVRFKDETLVMCEATGREAHVVVLKGRGLISATLVEENNIVHQLWLPAVVGEEVQRLIRWLQGQRDLPQSDLNPAA